MFSTIQHPFKLSTCYDPYISTYVVNSKDLFLFNNIVPAIYKNIILIKDTSVAVHCKEKKIIEKIIYKFDRKNICNLMLKDMAFVPNFYINIVATDLFRKQGYWFYHLDNIIRYGQDLIKNVVVIEIKTIYSLLIAEYKFTLSVYFYSPVSTTGTYILTAINPDAFYQYT